MQAGQVDTLHVEVVVVIAVDRVDHQFGGGCIVVERNGTGGRLKFAGRLLLLQSFQQRRQ